MLNFTHNPFVMSVVMLNVIMLNVIMPSVTAAKKHYNISTRIPHPVNFLTALPVSGVTCAEVGRLVPGKIQKMEGLKFFLTLTNTFNQK
jgi:hypothetical protein